MIEIEDETRGANLIGNSAEATFASSVLRVTGPTPSLVSVVDDDESVRESLLDLLRVCGFCARAFPSAEEFLESGLVGQTKCLILDIAMPGMTGPDLQRELRRRRHEIPIVYVTARTDETVRPRMIEQGAVECLFKPFSDTAILNAVATALRVS